MHKTNLLEKTAISEGVESAQPQLVRWGPSDGLPAGIWINNRNGQFIRWSELKTEVEERLINQLGRHLPAGCSLELRELFGRPDWIVRVVHEAKDIGSLWFGGNPSNDWRFDGLVRAGKVHSDTESVVWQTFQRFSDGSYRRV